MAYIEYVDKKTRKVFARQRLTKEKINAALYLWEMMGRKDRFSVRVKQEKRRLKRVM